MRVGFYKGLFILTAVMLPVAVFAGELPVSNLRNETSGVIFNKMSPAVPAESPLWKNTALELGDAMTFGLSGLGVRSIAAALPEFLPAGAVIAGWFVGDELADYLLEKNGYKARYQTPAMRPESGFYQCYYPVTPHKDGLIQAADVRAVLSECSGRNLAYFQSVDPDEHYVQGACDFSATPPLCEIDGTNIYGNLTREFSQATWLGPNTGAKPARYCDVNEVYIQDKGCVNVSQLNQPELGYDKLAEQLKNEGGYDKPSQPKLDADFINGLWKAASGIDGYNGIPYSDANKITESDINQWRQQHPDFVPAAGEYADNIPDDAGAAFPVPSGTPSHSGDLPVPTPTPTPAPDPDPTPGPDPKPDIHVDVHVDFGPDPGIPSPDIPDTPTGKQIIAPLWNLFPALHNFTLTTREVACPAPEFHLFGRDMKMDAQCIIAEKYRVQFGHIAMLLWVILSALVILAA